MAYYRRLAIPLSKDFATRLLRHYYAHPEHFANSYQFAHHVCGGFYFQHSGGIGAMLKSDFVTLDLHFRYRSKTAAGVDTLVNGNQRFTATDEIIQLPRVENALPEAMLNNDFALHLCEVAVGAPHRGHLPSATSWGAHTTTTRSTVLR